MCKNNTEQNSSMFSIRKTKITFSSPVAKNSASDRVLLKNSDYLHKLESQFLQGVEIIDLNIQ